VIISRTISAWDDGWGWFLLMLLIDLAIIVGALGLTAASWIVLQGVLCGHFYAKLAAAVERELGLPQEQIIDVPLRYQVYDALLDSGWLLMINAACLAVQIVPLIGTVVGVTAGAYFNCMTFGGDQLAHPLALRGWRRGEQRQFARQRRAHTLGLGAASLGLTLIPVLGPLLLSSAAAGAVLLHRNMLANDDLVLPANDVRTGKSLFSPPPPTTQP